MIRSLIWKQWMEQRWALALGCFVLVGFVTIGLQARLVQDSLIMNATGFIGVLVLPILVAMGLLAPERAERTLGTLQRLPVQPATVFAVKTLIGAVWVAVPLLAAGVATAILFGDREVPQGQVLLSFLRCVPAAIAVMVWTLVLGLRQPSEARVGMIGVALLVGSAALAIGVHHGLMFVIDREWISHPWPLAHASWRHPMQWLPQLVPVWHVRPVGSDWSIMPHGWVWSPIQLAVAAVVWLIGARRFAKPERTRG